MKIIFKRSCAAITALSLMTFGLMLAGCGSSGSEVSSQTVSGNASVGAPMSGQVSLKDSSDTPQEKTTVIGSDGSFAIDVTGLKAPFILQATGSAEGTNYTLYSYADDTGTANVNPLSNVVVASAADVDDPSEVYNHPDSTKLNRIKHNLSATVTMLLTKLQPLLLKYNAHQTNPITSHYISNHLGLDEMFDNVKITIKDGLLSIINTKSKAVIFSGKVTDIANGVFNGGALPPTASVPAVPAGLTAVGDAGQVTLSWTSVPTAAAYNVYYATNAGVTKFSGTKLASVSSPYVQTGLTAGTTYYYVVTSVNSAGESAASAQASAGTASTPPIPKVPAAPTVVSATGGTNQVTLSWGAVSTATSYNLYYATVSGVTKSNGIKISNTSSPAVQTGLAAGTTRYYIVTAVNSVGEGAASVQVAATTLTPVPTPTAPAAPSGVTAAGGANRVTLAWTAVSGATSYNLYRSTASGVTPASGTKIAGVTSPYFNTGLAAGTAYFYTVTAVNSAGESKASAQVTATTAAAPMPVPVAPTGVTATGGTNKVTLVWSAVSGATSYNVYYAATSGVTKTNGVKIVNATTPYAQTGLVAGTTYYFIVAAVNVSGEGLASPQTTATTSAAALDGAALYAQYCDSCHGPDKRGSTAAAIQGAINSNRGGMGSLSSLTAAKIAAIAAW